MPICPACQKEFPRRAKGGLCPGCGVAVTTKRLGNTVFWFYAGLGSPVLVLLEHFERLLSRRYKTPFYFKRKLPIYKKESAHAAVLLQYADGCVEDAKETLSLLFEDRRWNWREYTSLLQVFTDFLVGLIIVKRRKKKREDSEQANRDIFKRASSGIMDMIDE